MMVHVTLIASAVLASAAVALVLHPSAARLRSRPPARDVGAAGRDPGMDPVLRGALALACGVISGALLWRWAPWGSVVALPIGLAVHWGLGQWSSRSGREASKRLVDSLPDVCTLLAVCLDAGLPLRAAVAILADPALGSVGSLLAGVKARSDLGLADVEAWADPELPAEVRAVTRRIAEASVSGIALADLVRQEATEARSRAVGQAVIRARRVGVRCVVPLMTCFLPSFFLLGVVPVIAGSLTHLLG